MSKKICKNCHEVNSGTAVICSNCQSTLTGSEIIEEVNEEYKSLLRNDSINNYSTYTGNSEVVTIGTWMGIMLILAIPIVNLIAIFIMAFGSSNMNIKNFGRATLIFAGIGLVLSLLLIGIGTLR